MYNLYNVPANICSHNFHNVLISFIYCNVENKRKIQPQPFLSTAGPTTLVHVTLTHKCLEKCYIFLQLCHSWYDMIYRKWPHKSPCLHPHNYTNYNLKSPGHLGGHIINRLHFPLYNFMVNSFNEPYKFMNFAQKLSHFQHQYIWLQAQTVLQKFAK